MEVQKFSGSQGKMFVDRYPGSRTLSHKHPHCIYQVFKIDVPNSKSRGSNINNNKFLNDINNI